MHTGERQTVNEDGQDNEGEGDGEDAGDKREEGKRG